MNSPLKMLLLPAGEHSVWSEEAAASLVGQHTTFRDEKGVAHPVEIIEARLTEDPALVEVLLALSSPETAGEENER